MRPPETLRTTQNSIVSKGIRKDLNRASIMTRDVREKQEMGDFTARCSMSCRTKFGVFYCRPFGGAGPQSETFRITFFLLSRITHHIGKNLHTSGDMFDIYLYTFIYNFRIKFFLLSRIIHMPIGKNLHTSGDMIDIDIY